ncbi:autotransporter domain-containing protein [Chlamydia sp. 12-01]|uniref:polymorphic outer membrane protein middle domain-containing protein n=1 Tax=Chlamydia sp. 12-01 TaxID=3002742 RepID=UPI0035D4E857
MYLAPLSLVLFLCFCSYGYGKEHFKTDDNSSLSDFYFPIPMKEYSPIDKRFPRDTSTDLSISNYLQTEFFSDQSNKTMGGVVSCKSLNLTNNLESMFFVGNRSLENGGAIYAVENVLISKNTSVVFSKNNSLDTFSTPLSATCSGGSIATKNFEASYNTKSLEFVANTCKYRGGAIYAETKCVLSNNSADILFEGNLATFLPSFGGAIYTESCEIANNSGKITFINNGGQGGAIRAETSTTIKDNTGTIIFMNNRAPISGMNPFTADHEYARGGGILSSQITIENNTGPIYFDGNLASAYGGALDYTRLTIKNNGPVYFLNNSAHQGAALYVKNGGGTTTISADYGDIVFDNNVINEGNHLVRCISHFGASHTLSLGARQDYKICLYDTINTNNLNSFSINPEAHHTGAVVFSGKHVQPTLIDNLRNFQTSYIGEITVKYGTLAIKSGAQLSAYKITQDDSSYLALGKNTVVRTQEKSSSDKTSILQLKNLLIDLPEVLNPQSEPPMIWMYPDTNNNKFIENTNAEITIKGSIELYDGKQKDFYDSLDLSQPINGIALLHLSETAAKAITTTDLNIQTINPGEHYGHQGLWSPYWAEITTATNDASAETANTKHRYLYADWTPLGYTPNPLYKGDLVPNLLWQSAYLIANIPSSMPKSNLEESTFIEGEGLGLYIHQSNKYGNSGFSSRAYGYAVKGQATSATNQCFALSFAQIIGKTLENQTNHKSNSHSYLASLCWHVPWFNDSLITSASFRYCYSDHHLKSSYNQGQQKSQTEFYNHALCAVFGWAAPELYVFSDFSITPFMQIIALQVEQTDIKEVGDYARTFSNQHPLRNIALPIGGEFSGSSYSKIPTTWELEFSYQPTIYRNKPKVLTTLLASKGSWSSSATSVAKNAFHAKGKYSIYPFPNLRVFLNYQLDLSSSTTAHYVHIGSRWLF